MRLGWLIALAAFGCGAGSVGEAVRPDAPTASEALGETQLSNAECRDVTRGAEPLIVDWKAEQRGDLEIAMKQGVAVVDYGCDGLKLLSECRIAGDYGFIGMTRKEQLVRLSNADEVRANLPLSGARMSGELERGATLDVAIVMVGKKRTAWSEPSAADLQGECKGATHYVRGALVGAFAVESGTAAKVRTVAELFTASASAASQSEKRVSNKDGDLSDCGKAKPDSESPPPQCGAAVRLVLAPIVPARAAAKPEKQPPTSTCPSGLVFAEGKCTTPASAPAFQCRAGEEVECNEQCSKGHAGSCALLGDIRRRSDAAAATKAYETGCNGGAAEACRGLGELLLDGKHRDRAIELLRKACDDGDATACGRAGAALGKKANGPELSRRGCSGGHAASCLDVAALYEMGGEGIGKNSILAETFYRRACFSGIAEACAHLGRLEYVRGPDAAKLSFQNACLRRSEVGCAALKVLYGEQRPFVADLRRRSALQATCNAGDMRDCAVLGLIDAASGNPLARPTLLRACQRGDKLACDVEKKLGNAR